MKQGSVKTNKQTNKQTNKKSLSEQEEARSRARELSKWLNKNITHQHNPTTTKLKKNVNKVDRVI